MIGRSGERGSGISVPVARHDDIEGIILHKHLFGLTRGGFLSFYFSKKIFPIL